MARNEIGFIPKVAVSREQLLKRAHRNDNSASKRVYYEKEKTR